MRSERKRTGFTMIEMLVSLTIIAAILSMVYGSYAATTRSMDTSSDRMACIERACLVLRLMERQIRCAYAPSPDAGSPARRAPGAASGGALRDTGALPRSSGGLFQGDSRDARGWVLSLVTTGGPGGANVAHGLSHVAYQYDRAAVTLSICRQDRVDPLHDPADSKLLQPLLHNVTAVTLKFHDGRQWQDAWDFRQRHRLPRAVKVELVVTDRIGRAYRLGTTVPIAQQTNAEYGNVRQTAVAGSL